MTGMPEPTQPSSALSRGIDEAIVRQLLAEAMSTGGDYADLYFEHRAGTDYTYEDHAVKSISHGVTCGLGVRVIAEDATGYAYCEQLDLAAMKRAARTAAQIARSGGGAPPQRIEAVKVPDYYPIAAPMSSVAPAEKLALSAGGDYADLFFEYRAGADYVYEDERVKAVGRGITLGLGVRVTKGDATRWPSRPV